MSAPIVVALSGGVDSATAAGLLVEAGERVVGISMHLYNAMGTAASSGGRCCGPRDLEDARRICNHLGVPFYVADYANTFQEHVINNFIAEYAAGHTPNPCVDCNIHIKFLPLLRMARALGAQALVTGHYARIVVENGVHYLARAADPKKDQTYFLYGMPRGALPYVRFPLGGMTKVEVRAEARRMGLPVADKAESMEICFIPDGDHAAFIRSRTTLPEGEIVDAEGHVLGRHDGIQGFTIGQRRGLRVISGSDPLYVTGIDAEKAQVRVGPRSSLERREVFIRNVVWAGAENSFRADVQIRHRHAARPAQVEPTGPNEARVLFDEPERALAPGQAAVFYRGDLVAGGGIIAA